MFYIRTEHVDGAVCVDGVISYPVAGVRADRRWKLIDEGSGIRA